MVVYLYNEMAEYRLQNSRYFYYNGHKYYRATQQNMRERMAEAITAQSQRRHAKIKASYEKAYKRALDIERMNDKTADGVGLALSVASTQSPHVKAARFFFAAAAMGVDGLQGDAVGFTIGGAAMVERLKPYGTILDLTYGVWQVMK
jgi:hypothetical protein